MDNLAFASARARLVCSTASMRKTILLLFSKAKVTLVRFDMLISIIYLLKQYK
jgi:hypothetical protein